MTDVKPLPKIKELLFPTLKAIKKEGGSATKSELEKTVPEIAGISEAQLEVKFPQGSAHEGRPKILYKIGWVLTQLKKLEAVNNSERGVWSATSTGLEYLADENKLIKDYKALKTKRNKLYKLRKNQIGQTEDQEDNIEDDEAEDGWKNSLLKTLKNIAPDAFERLTMRILKEAGFRNVEVLGKSGDQGIDGVGTYKVSLVSFPTYFQCKRYFGSVSAGAVRDFRGAMAGRGDKGILITTGTFTSSARSEANKPGAPPIDLIDGDELCDLLVEYEIGVRVEQRTVKDITVDKGFFESV